jgi:hypothetical protein
MATTTVQVNYKPDTKTTLDDLKSHVELLESIADATATDVGDIAISQDVDYGDDERHVLVATWDV